MDSMGLASSVDKCSSMLEDLHLRMGLKPLLPLCLTVGLLPLASAPVPWLGNLMGCKEQAGLLLLDLLDLLEVPMLQIALECTSASLEERTSLQTFPLDVKEIFCSIE